MKLVER